MVSVVPVALLLYREQASRATAGSFSDINVSIICRLVIVSHNVAVYVARPRSV